MKINTEFEPHEIEIVRTTVKRKLHANRLFVQHRLQHNVEGPSPEITDEDLWMTLTMCLLSTQQRSGPGSAIDRLLQQKPFPLSLAECRNFGTVEQHVLQILAYTGGIRRTNRIAKAVETNLQTLDSGGWDGLRRWCDQLLVQRALPPTFSNRELEENAAAYMDRFLEFGPKQARNFWQSLGLTRYVFVLDSRTLKWLNEHLTLPVGLLTSAGLNDPKYYRFISDILLELCNQAEVLPCMFDAAVFDSFDEAREWTGEIMW